MLLLVLGGGCNVKTPPPAVVERPPEDLPGWTARMVAGEEARTRARRGFEVSLGRPAFSIARAASPLPRDNPATPDIDEAATYFESCPDGAATPAGPVCYPMIPAGGGFYTLSQDIGGARQVVKVGSNQTFAHPLLPRREPNPFFFEWRATAGEPLQASLHIDNMDWRASSTPNIYFGLHFNTPRGGGLYYFGGQDLAREYMHTDGAFTQVELRVDPPGRGPQDVNARARFLIGVVWSSPRTGLSYDVELNLENVLSSAGTIDDVWSAALPIARNATAADQGVRVKFLYLGGRGWGVAPALAGNGWITVKIPWRHILARLVETGELEADALSDQPARPVTLILGIEQLGRLDNQLGIRRLEQFDVTP